MLEGKSAILEFETMLDEYKKKDARGIPMSVRERYEKALSENRSRIRREKNGGRGKKLGEILVESGVIDQAQLQQGLAEQGNCENGKLLGEILVSLGLIKEEALLSALNRQIDIPHA